MFDDDEELQAVLMGNSKSAAAPPIARRKAVHFRYGDIDPEYSMCNIGALAMPMVEHRVISSSLRDSYNTPGDSWEIELCVGFAVKRIISPHWNQIMSLGRSLAIFKVHKEPPVCELFFMPRDEVIKTYKDTVPKTLEWVHLYDPANEFVFWAELYRPSKKAGRGTSLLTDELCGGFGSRYCVAKDLEAKALALAQELMEDPESKKAREKIKLLTSTATRQECEALAAQAQAKIDKNRRKKERQKERNREKKKEQQEEAKRLQQELEAQQAAAARASRIPAPHLDFTSLLAPSAADDEGASSSSDSSRS